MPQKFRTRKPAPLAATSQPRAAQLADTATEYFAYIALITVAVGVAVMTMGFSANVAFRYLDKVAKPGYFDGDIHQTSSPTSPSPAAKTVKRAQFAMLPAAMPLQMKDDVISSNY